MEQNTSRRPAIKPNTIGSLYQQSARFEGLTGQHNDHTLRIDAFTFQWRTDSPNRHIVDFQLRLTWSVGQAQDTIELRNGRFDQDLVTGMNLPIDDGAWSRMARYLDTLAEQLSEQPQAPHQTTSPRWPNTTNWPFFIIGAAQTPPQPNGLIDYLDANLFELLCPDTKIITTATHHDHVWHIECLRFELLKQTLSRRKYGAIHIRDIIRGPDAAILNIYETEIPLGYMDAALWPMPAPDHTQRQHIEHLTTQWRAHTARRAQQMMDTFDVDEFVHYGYTKTCWYNDSAPFELMEMITHGLQHGPPPPAPRSNVEVEMDHLSAAQCEPVDRMDTLFGLCIGPYTLTFCDVCDERPRHNAHIYLDHPDQSEAMLILSSDIMNRTRLSADGHAYVMTMLLQVCANYFSNVDEAPRVTFEYEDEDDEGEYIEARATLDASAWLDLTQDALTKHWVDWRVQSHAVCAGWPINQTTTATARYHAFIQYVLGQAFFDVAYAPGNHHLKTTPTA